MTSCDGEAGAILGLRECSGYSFVRNLARFKLKEKNYGEKARLEEKLKENNNCRDFMLDCYAWLYSHVRRDKY